MKPEISYEDFEKLDLRVAEIINVEEIPNADKLYKLTLDVDDLGERTVCAGIKQYYSRDELKGKKIILLANLAPRKLKGIESQGMILAASTENHKEVVLLSLETDIEVGSKIS
jgi:methionine--tRNA ligase beta chain